MGGREDWGLSPVGWSLVHVTAVIELASIIGWWPPLGTLGIVHVPASVMPGLAVLALLPGLLAGGRKWWPFLLGGGTAAVVLAWSYQGLFDGADGIFGYALAALHEEVVYRAVLPLIVWRLLRRAGADRARSGMAAIIVPACVFSVLPYHLSQAGGSPLGLLPFFCFAVFLGLLIRRPDALLPAALAHLTVNLLTIPVIHGFVSPVARAVAVAVLLGGFAFVALFGTGEPEPAQEAVREEGIPDSAASVGSWDPTI